VKLTFATWNTLTGGIDAGSDARLRRQLGLLASLSPAVIGLQECWHWDRDYYRLFHRAEQLLGMRGFLSPSPHHGCHLAIFIRPGAGLRVTQQRHEHGHPYWHGAARIVPEAGEYPEPLDLASVHLAPSSPAIRLAEAEALGLIAGERPAILGGDFNALPAGDPAPPGAAGRARRKLDRGPAEALEETGFLDAGACFGDTTPTVGHDGGLAYRCDRLYTTLPAEAVTDYQVITSADADSDHRPVVAEFDLA
jgi:endonuclease/exonuclease/phosphatase family metal-dependent hydrolase